MRIRFSITLCVISALALAACTDTSQLGDGKNKTRDGAALGGAIGAVTGLIVGDSPEERRRGVAIGAILGAGVGAAIGNSLDKQAAALEQSIANDRIGIVNTGSALIVTMPQDLLFATDSAILGVALQSDLRVLARSLNEYPGTTVDIIGHTDNTGEAAYNQGLSSRRALAVAAILSDSGVSAQRMRAYGRGEDAPVASNLSADGRAQNRRVEIIIRPNS
ncbi:MAG: outer membrane protein OmpA-like peptidoglycan-associated protein [Paracoccaceae bacterium]|jgi:outer membrane protein OmpA-like peptidoglycan-associated protein